MKYLIAFFAFATLLNCSVSTLYSQTKPEDTDNNGYINISTLDNLRWVTENPSSWEWNFELDNDIDASVTKHADWKFLPIGSDPEENGTAFTGIFKGNNHRIFNLYINAPDKKYVGLFAYISKNNLDQGGEITQLGIINCSITGRICVGAIAGYSKGNIKECCASGNLTGENCVGGIIGWNDGNIEQCFSYGEVNGSYTGGVVGYNDYGTVRNCYSRAKVTGKEESGGIVGSNYGAIYYCYSAGIVLGDKTVGGAIGFSHYVGVDYNFFDNSLNNSIPPIGDGLTYGAGGLSTEKMKSKSSFTEAGWDFDNIWDIDIEENDGYPILKGMQTVSVKINKLTEVNRINIFPNPATNQISVNNTLFGDIKIYNSLGMLVIQHDSNTRAENSTMDLDISHLELGTYDIIVSEDDNLKFGRFIKK